MLGAAEAGLVATERPMSLRSRSRNRKKCKSIPGTISMGHIDIIVAVEGRRHNYKKKSIPKKKRKKSRQRLRRPLKSR